MQLWRCINAMKRRCSSADGAVIPFRDNKLTHILMPHLGRAGLAGVAMLTCVNPSVDDYDETVSILGNASLACKIKEIIDVRANMRMSATAVERALERANNKEAKAALGEIKKRRAENNGVVPPAKYAREGIAVAKGNSKRASDIVIAPTMPLLVVPVAVSETVLTRESADVSKLRSEVSALRCMNVALVAELASKEASIRLEVSAEMQSHSTHLLEQIQTLQMQLLQIQDEQRGQNDVQKSCRKARRRQNEMAGAGASRDQLAAEEEAEALKVDEYSTSIRP
jgi:hypothetical protein